MAGDPAFSFYFAPRRGKNTQFPLADLLRQSVYSRLAGCEDLNDAQICSESKAGLNCEPCQSREVLFLGQHLGLEGLELGGQGRTTVPELLRADQTKRRILAQPLGMREREARKGVGASVERGAVSGLGF